MSDASVKEHERERKREQFEIATSAEQVAEESDRTTSPTTTLTSSSSNTTLHALTNEFKRLFIHGKPLTRDGQHDMFKKMKGERCLTERGKVEMADFLRRHENVSYAKTYLRWRSEGLRGAWLGKRVREIKGEKGELEEWFPAE